ncbi:MAG: DUF4157 domain-containing protein [Gemmatimonadaceae bacterium]
MRSGRGLDASARVAFEPRFNHSFANVQVHSVERTAPEGRVLPHGAAAVVQGSDLFFAPGEYAPGTPRGDLLLAHELAHVVQFDRALDEPNENCIADPSRDAAGESEAKGAAADVIAGINPSIAAPPPASPATGMLDWLEETADSATATISDAASAVSGTASSAWGATKGAASDIYSGMKENAGYVRQAEHWAEGGIDSLVGQSKAGWEQFGHSADGIPVLEQLAGGAGWLGEGAAGVTGGLLKGATGLLGGVTQMVANPVDAAVSLEGMAEHIRLAPGMANPLQVMHGLYNVAAKDADFGAEMNRTFNPEQVMKDDAKFGTQLVSGIAKPYVEAYNKGNYSEMVGRGGFDIGMLLLGVGEAEAAAGGAEALAATSEISEGTQALSAVSELSEGAEGLKAAGDLGELSEGVSTASSATREAGAVSEIAEGSEGLGALEESAAGGGGGGGITEGGGGTGGGNPSNQLQSRLEELLENGASPQEHLGFSPEEWEKFQSTAATAPEEALADLEGRMDRMGTFAEETAGVATEAEPGVMIPESPANPLDLPEYQAAVEDAQAMQMPLPEAGEKTFAQSPHADMTGSGWSGAEADTDRVLSEAESAGHDLEPHMHDPVGEPGKYHASHAEKKLGSDVAQVNKEMCTDCQGFFQDSAVEQGAPRIVDDPAATRVFMPDGSVHTVPTPGGASAAELEAAEAASTADALGGAAEYESGKAPSWMTDGATKRAGKAIQGEWETAMEWMKKNF